MPSTVMELKLPYSTRPCFLQEALKTAWLGEATRTLMVFSMEGKNVSVVQRHISRDANKGQSSSSTGFSSRRRAKLRDFPLDSCAEIDMQIFELHLTSAHLQCIARGCSRPDSHPSGTPRRQSRRPWKASPGRAGCTVRVLWVLQRKWQMDSTERLDRISHTKWRENKQQLM